MSSFFKSFRSMLNGPSLVCFFYGSRQDGRLVSRCRPFVKRGKGLVTPVLLTSSSGMQLTQLPQNHGSAHQFCGNCLVGWSPTTPTGVEQAYTPVCSPGQRTLQPNQIAVLVIKQPQEWVDRNCTHALRVD